MTSQGLAGGFPSQSTVSAGPDPSSWEPPWLCWRLRILSTSGVDPQRWGHGAAAPVIFPVFLNSAAPFSSKVSTHEDPVCPLSRRPCLQFGVFLVWAMGSLWSEPAVRGMSRRRDLPDVLLMNHADRGGFMVGRQREGEPEALQCHPRGWTCPPPCSKLCQPQPKATQ